MAAEIVADGEFDAVVQRIQIAEHVLDLRRSQLRIGLGDIVEVGDIGGVVAVVMDFHRLGVDMRFERIGRIGERRQREGAGWGRGRGRRGGLREDETWGRGNGRDTGCGKHQMAPGHG